MRSRRRTVAGIEMLFLAVEHELHRNASGLRQFRAQDALAANLSLATETAAHVLGDDANIGLRNPEPLRHLLRDTKNALRRAPHGQLVAVPFANCAVRFHANVRDDVRRVGLLNDVRRLLEAGIEIAILLRLAGAGIPTFEDLWRIRRHRTIHKSNLGQHFVLNFDEPRSVPRTLFGIGGHSRNRIALIHQFGARLFQRKRRFDAGQLLRIRKINGNDAGVRVRRTDHLSVNHARTVDVECIFRAACDFVGTIEALHRCTEQRGLLGPRPLFR